MDERTHSLCTHIGPQLQIIQRIDEHLENMGTCPALHPMHRTYLARFHAISTCSAFHPIHYLILLHHIHTHSMHAIAWCARRLKAGSSSRDQCEVSENWASDGTT